MHYLTDGEVTLWVILDRFNVALRCLLILRGRPDRMQMVRQDDDGLDVERMAPPNIAERLAQEVDVIDEKTQAALSQIGREEKAAAADKVSPIVRHRVSVAQLKVIAAARRWVSRSLSSGRPLRAGPVGSTHPTG